eukprot:8771522-Pyramimonas_sp.AAC.1
MHVVGSFAKTFFGSPKKNPSLFPIRMSLEGCKSGDRSTEESRRGGEANTAPLDRLVQHPSRLRFPHDLFRGRALAT